LSSVAEMNGDASGRNDDGEELGGVGATASGRKELGGAAAVGRDSGGLVGMGGSEGELMRMGG
jgi:hypothetical protein